MVLRLLSLLFGISLGLFTLPFSSLAAIGSTSDFTLSTTPQYPQSFQTVVITPESSVVDLAASTMQVFVNNKKISAGNVGPFSVTLGAPGTQTTVKVILIGEGSSFTQTLVLSGADVALVREAIASAPVLYLGKPIVPSDGSVRAVAIADFRTSKGISINPNALSYTWVLDNTILQNESGIGRSSVVVHVPLQYRTRTLSVTVKTLDGGIVGGATMDIAGNEPTIRIYENDPLLGIRFDRALAGTFQIGGSELSLIGMPYSFSLDGGSPVLSWVLNGAAAQGGTTLTLRPQGSGTGAASLSLSAEKTSTSESARSDVSLTFTTAPARGGLFGL